MQIKNPSPDEYLPIFEKILNAADPLLKKEQIDVIRELLEAGEPYKAKEQLFDILWYSLGKDREHFYNENSIDLSKLRKLLYDTWFENTVEFFKDKLGKAAARAIVEAWQYGEEESAYESLIGSLEWQDVTFPIEMQPKLLDYAAKLDKFNEDKWKEYEREFTAEQIKDFNLKKRRTDYVKELQELLKNQTSNLNKE